MNKNMIETSTICAVRKTKRRKLSAPHHTSSAQMAIWKSQLEYQNNT
jgi:hypothetical protein